MKLTSSFWVTFTHVEHRTSLGPWDTCSPPVSLRFELCIGTHGLALACPCDGWRVTSILLHMSTAGLKAGILYPLSPSCWHPWSCPISFVGSIPHIGLPLLGNCAYILSGILRLLLCSANEAFHMMSSLAFDQYGGVMLSQVAGQGRGLPFPSVDAPFIFATCGSVWKTGWGQHWEESHSRNAVIMS